MVFIKTISKLTDECKKCLRVDECNNKRMEACAMKEQKQSMADITVTAAMTLTQPSLRIEHPITINIGEDCVINTSLEEMSEKLKKDFYKHLDCSFNR